MIFFNEKKIEKDSDNFWRRKLTLTVRNWQFLITWFRAGVNLPENLFHEKVLFFTQLSYHLMCMLLKKSYMLSTVYTTALTLLAATCNVFYIYRNIFLYPRATSHSFSYIIHLSVHQSLYFMHWKSFASNVPNCVWKSGIDIFIHFLQVCLFSWIDLKTLNQVYTRLKFLKLGK